MTRRRRTVMTAGTKPRAAHDRPAAALVRCGGDAPSAELGSSVNSRRPGQGRGVASWESQVGTACTLQYMWTALQDSVQHCAHREAAVSEMLQLQILSSSRLKRSRPLSNNPGFNAVAEG